MWRKFVTCESANAQLTSCATIMRLLHDCRLYGIIDLGYVEGFDAARIGEQMIEGGVDLIQLRGKGKSLGELVDLAAKLCEVTAKSSTPLIVNDHAEIARHVPVQGVHVGQDDDPIEVARQKATRDILVGKSTHSIEQARAAQSDGADDSFRNGDTEWVIREEPEKKRVYDLEERTARFGEAVIDFAKTIPQNPVTNRLISQLVGAGTSVGANYVEADDSVSKKDFLKSIGTCRKEARETKHFLRMIARAVPELKQEARELWMEARELHLIFSRIWRGRKNE